MTKARQLPPAPPRNRLGEDVLNLLERLEKDPDRKWFFPSFRCERNNVFVGPMDAYEDRETAESVESGEGQFLAMLLGFEPDTVRELSYNDLQAPGVIFTSMHHAPAWVIEGPITEQYNQPKEAITG